jgi:hypothetical protein
MAKFKVTLERMAVMIREVEVDADSQEEANEQAINDDGSGDFYDYGFVDFDDGPPKVLPNE